MPTVLNYLFFAILPFGLAYAAISDVMTMTISNRVTLALAAAFVVLAPLTGMDLQTFAMHGAAGGLMLALTFSLFAMGWIGGGDAKLAAVTVLWFGWSAATLEFIGVASVFGGLLTFGILAFRRLPVAVYVMRTPWIARLHDGASGVPYGVALAAGGLAVYPHSIWMQLVAA